MPPAGRPPGSTNDSDTATMERSATGCPAAGDCVGRSVARVDSIAKLTGRTRFCSDELPARCLHVAVLHPEIACGRLIAIDCSAAEAMLGVVAVLTGRDLPAADRIGMIVDDQPVIVKDVFRCSSDVLAVVAAESPEIARRALKAIQVSVLPLPGVFDCEEALQDGAPEVNDDCERVAGNVLAHYKIRKGDAEAAFAAAEVVVENTFRTHHIDHAFLEPEAGLAYVEADGTLVLKGCMQAPFLTRRKVAGVVGCPVSHVRVMSPPLGGGFGGKEESGLKIGAWTGLLALRTGRPVLYQRTRWESMVGNGKREPMVIRHRLAADGEGRLLALSAQILMDKGAYASLGGGPNSVAGMLKKASLHLPGPYRIDHVRVDGISVLTNNVPTCPMRGLGTPQVHLATESQVDEVARRLGLDAFDIRMRNGLEAGCSTASGQVLDHSVGLKRCISALRERATAHQTGPRSGANTRHRRGRGIACGWYATGTASNRDSAGAIVTLADDGGVVVGVNIVEMGQGATTVFAQIAAETMGVRVDQVRLLPVDTSVAPNAGITAGSRSTTVPGRAVHEAARDLRARLEPVAADLLGIEIAELDIRDGRIASRGPGPNLIVTYQDVAQAAVGRAVALQSLGWVASPAPVTDLETGQGEPFPVYSYGAQMAEVEVDTLTGAVRVIELWAAQDVGHALNPAAVMGQIEGGMVMALGQALYEEFKVSSGMPVNPTFTNYMLASTLEAPKRMTVDIVEDAYGRGPFGAKGVGEMCLVPTMAAIANAIRDATGVRLTEMPATRERTLRALREAA